MIYTCFIPTSFLFSTNFSFLILWFLLSSIFFFHPHLNLLIFFLLPLTFLLSPFIPFFLYYHLSVLHSPSFFSSFLHFSFFFPPIFSLFVLFPFPFYFSFFPPLSNTPLLLYYIPLSFLHSLLTFLLPYLSPFSPLRST